MNTKNRNSTKIYIVAHKPFECSLLEGYEVIEVGASLRKDVVHNLRDDVGINISQKNRNYCELTAHYWLWKHAKDDLIGLVHYRRFFSKFYTNENSKYFLKVDEINRILSTFDIILPHRIRWKNYTVAEGYCHGEGLAKDLIVLKSVIKEKYPSYVNAMDDICNNHEASYCNMLICSKRIFDNYSEWLFDILFEVEKRIDVSAYSQAEARVFGYMAEILLNVWVKKQGLKVCYMPIVKIGINSRKKRIVMNMLERMPGGKRVTEYFLDREFNVGQ